MAGAKCQFGGELHTYARRLLRDWLPSSKSSHSDRDPRNRHASFSWSPIHAVLYGMARLIGFTDTPCLSDTTLAALPRVRPNQSVFTRIDIPWARKFWRTRTGFCQPPAHRCLYLDLPPPTLISAESCSKTMIKERQTHRGE